jgi:hypothetical protein
MLDNMTPTKILIHLREVIETKWPLGTPNRPVLPSQKQIKNFKSAIRRRLDKKLSGSGTGSGTKNHEFLKWITVFHVRTYLSSPIQTKLPLRGVLTYACCFFFIYFKKNIFRYRQKKSST